MVPRENQNKLFEACIQYQHILNMQIIYLIFLNDYINFYYMVTINDQKPYFRHKKANFDQKYA